MKKKKFTALLAAALVMQSTLPQMSVLAYENEVGNPIYYIDTENQVVTSPILEIAPPVEEEREEVTISRFDTFYLPERAAYDSAFKIDNKHIVDITSSGGSLRENVTTEKMLDGDINTYWETKRHTNASFKNEVTFTFDEVTELDRIAYRSAWNTVGFATEFAIWVSTSVEGDDFRCIADETMSKTADMLEIKFNKTAARRVNFVFKNNGTATISEIMFYKEDKLSDEMKNLFVDESGLVVSPAYNSLSALQALEDRAKDHPLAKRFKELIIDAKAIIEDRQLVAVEANTRIANYVANEAYNERYKVPSEMIQSISTNGKHYWNQKIELAGDGDLDTYWETNSWNRNGFYNEIEVTFKERVTIDRLAYAARKSDSKGFANKFEIYGSTTSKGDNYQLLAKGGHHTVKDFVEVQFKETEVKRVKFRFIEGTQDWATMRELMFYTKDEVREAVENIFTDGTMSEVVEKYNSLDKLAELEALVGGHPLKDELQGSIDYAKEVLTNPVEGVTLELEMRGNSVKETQKRKMWSFKDYQVTGLYALGGETITVYVDVAEGEAAPTLHYKQAMTQHGGTEEFKLQRGKNVITIPQLDKARHQIPENVIQGGELFFTNYDHSVRPDTPNGYDQFVKAPKVRIEGAHSYPVFKLGESNEQEVLRELDAYVAKINAEPETTPDIFAVSSDKALCLTQATYAKDYYARTNTTPKDTALGWDNTIYAAMFFWGFDGSSELNSDYNFRILPMVKNLSGGAFMNAGGGVIGIRPGNQDCILGADRGWGTMHELGHNFDTAGRTVVESTNNIMPLFFESFTRPHTRLTDQNIYENNTYPKVGLDDYSNNALYNVNDSTHLAQILPLWQLYMYDNTSYGKMEQKYREGNFSSGDRNAIHRSWVEHMSHAMELDLTEFFARHGIRVDAETKASISAKYNKPKKKIYYLNDKAMRYEGDGFVSTPQVEIKTSAQDGKVKLSFNIDETNKDHLLGYEILKEGKYIGFTSKESFIDENSNLDDEAVYTVTPYDIKLNAATPISVNASQVNIFTNPVVTLEMGETFKEKENVIAKDMKGNLFNDRITVKSNNVDTSRAGDYTVIYAVTDDNGIEYTGMTKVKVVSKKTYLSDLKADKTQNGWGTVRPDKSITGGTIGLLRNGDIIDYKKGLGLHAPSEYVYNLDGKSYDQFEAYVGVDKAYLNGTYASIEFKVYVDGVEKFNSGLMRPTTDQKYVKVDVKGAKELKLVITTGNNGNTQDHGNWADAKLITCQ